MMEDPIVDEVHRAFERVLKRCGGIEGLFKHLQAMDRARLRKANERRRKRVAKTVRTNATSAGVTRATRKKAQPGTGRRAKRTVSA